MIRNSFDAIRKADIDTLIEDGVHESKTLEYKRTLPGNSDKERKEFLADVSSLANASGGDLVYGVRAQVDECGRSTGAPERVEPLADETPDGAKLRLENMIRNGIDPRLQVQIKEIVGWGDAGTGWVILLRVPMGFASPYMVTFKGSSRFYSRNSGGKYALDVHELRAAFLATDSQAVRIRRFRLDRLGKIIADETPIVLSSTHRLVLHVIPIGSFLNNERLDLPRLPNLPTLFPPVGGLGGSSRYNLDGFLTHTGDDEGKRRCNSFCQLFFDGTVESVFSDVLRKEGGVRVSSGIGFIASVAYEKRLIDAVHSYLTAYQQLNLVPPIAISLALLGCRGSYMYTHDPCSSGHPIDRDTVILPDIVIDTLDTDVPRALRPTFDAVWNTCGFPCSLNYNRDGDWKPPR